MSEGQVTYVLARENSYVAYLPIDHRCACYNVRKTFAAHRARSWHLSISLTAEITNIARRRLFEGLHLSRIVSFWVLEC
jgi:hypothetical protein